jgi:hypothetical protein
MTEPDIGFNPEQWQITHSLIPQYLEVNRKGHPTEWEPHQKIHILDD